MRSIEEGRDGWRRGRAGAAAAFVLLLVVAVLGSSEPRPERRTAGEIKESLPGGQLVPLQDARSSFGHALPLPSTAAENDETIREVWIRSGEDAEVFVIYDSGVIVYVDPAKSFPISLQEWFARQVQDGVPSDLETIEGVEAYVVPSDPDRDMTGSLKMFIEDSVVTVIGNGRYATEDLRAIAASIVSRSAAEN